MKSTKFSKYLTKFFKIYLPCDRNLSIKTIESYSNTFSKFLKFLKNQKNIDVSKFDVNDFNREIILDFLRSLEGNGNSPRTINQRKAAFSSFCNYLRYEEPALSECLDAIINIKQKKYINRTISYLKNDGMNLFLKQINTSNINGVRDFLMLTFMMLLGMRVSEVINIKAKHVQLSDPSTITVLGKGRKERILIVNEKIIPYLKLYIEKLNLNKPEASDKFIFLNHMNKQFTRHGVNFIVKKYGDMARKISPNDIPSDLSCHKLRHSCGAAAARAGVDLIFIRDMLGHESIQTTQIYVGLQSNEEKEEALEKIAGDIIDENDNMKSLLDDDQDLIEFLDGLCRQ